MVLRQPGHAPIGWDDRVQHHALDVLRVALCVLGAERAASGHAVIQDPLCAEPTPNRVHVVGPMLQAHVGCQIRVLLPARRHVVVQDLLHGDHVVEIVQHGRGHQHGLQLRSARIRRASTHSTRVEGHDVVVFRQLAEGVVRAELNHVDHRLAWAAKVEEQRSLGHTASGRSAGHRQLEGGTVRVRVVYRQLHGAALDHTGAGCTPNDLNVRHPGLALHAGSCVRAGVGRARCGRSGRTREQHQREHVDLTRWACVTWAHPAHCSTWNTTPRSARSPPAGGRSPAHWTPAARARRSRAPWGRPRLPG